VRAAAILLVVGLVSLSAGCGRVRGAIGRFGPPTPTPTPDWVGKIQESATPMSTYQARVGDVDPQTGRAVTFPIALRETPGRGGEPTGFSVQPGERIFITGVERIGNERFFKVRSFDGLKRGWLAEAQINPADRPPA
jgi:hypothetical protein